MMTLHATERYLERTCGDSVTDARHLAPHVVGAAAADLMRSKAVRAALTASCGSSSQVTVAHPQHGRIVIRDGKIITVLRKVSKKWKRT